jgi:hypothetical protein
MRSYQRSILSRGVQNDARLQHYDHLDLLPSIHNQFCPEILGPDLLVGTFNVTANIRLGCNAEALPPFTNLVSVSLLKLRFSMFEIA